MFDAIHDVTGRGIIDYATKPRTEWVLEWPGMVVLVVTAIYWTKGALVRFEFKYATFES